MLRRKLKVKAKAHPDYLIMTCLALLVVFGLTMLASASSNLGKIKFDDTYYYLKHQLIYGLIPGALGFFFLSRIYYRSYEKFAVVFLIVSIVLLSLVFTPLGVTAKGANRWLSFGPITFQPGEIVKITFILYLAAWLSKGKERQKNFLRGFLPFVLIIGSLAALLLGQPATSTAAILIGTALIIYFMSGARWLYVLGFGLVGALIFLSLIYTTPYRWERIKAFLDPNSNIQTTGYHLNQARIAIGSGGLTGVGFGKSTTKISYLPEPVGDSIFAIIAEEFGFIGASVMATLFLFLILRIFLLSRKTADGFARLILIGFGTLIAFQVFIHIGAISGLLPLTGTPLPFVSYGGTALAVFMSMGGIAVNISKYV